MLSEAETDITTAATTSKTDRKPNFIPTSVHRMWHWRMVTEK
jgi:hypothetical protein